MTKCGLFQGLKLVQYVTINPCTLAKGEAYRSTE